MSKIIEIGSEEFAQITNDHKRSKHLLIEFFTPTCRPCKMLLPTLEQFAKDNDNIDVYKIDSSKCSDLARSLNVTTVPMMFFYAACKQEMTCVSQLRGVCSLDKLQDEWDEICDNNEL